MSRGPKSSFIPIVPYVLTYSNIHEVSLPQMYRKVAAVLQQENENTSRWSTEKKKKHQSEKKTFSSLNVTKQQLTPAIVRSDFKEIVLTQIL